MAKKAYIAIDLGAESGRVVVGLLEGNKLTLDEKHRFAHRPLRLPTGLHWNLTGLFEGVLTGLRKTAEWSRAEQIPLASLGVDAWGVDWATIGPAGELLGLPHCYRDEAHVAAFERLMDDPGGEAIYEATGIQLLALNTLFQVAARHQSEPAILTEAHNLLFMPDLFHYLFTGRAVVEETIASTSQMTDAVTGRWATDLLNRLGLPTHLLGEIVQSGTTIGPLLPQIAAELGLDSQLLVVAPAAHDTAAAVAAVPASQDTRWCYLSSGTWSLMGAELDSPIISPQARDAPFTNERGVGGKIRFLKNIIGLWLVQQCRAELVRQGIETSYAELTEAASGATPFRTILDPDHEPFMLPGGMFDKIAQFARQSGQSVPESPGQFVRACLETLALTYRRTLDRLEEVTAAKYDVLHIVGGGSKNQLLCQMTADALGRPVVAGPDEATAAGNVLTQALGAGDLADLWEIRRIVAASWEPVLYQPTQTAAWEDAYGRFLQLRGEN
jgi:rhamnulokinase